MAQYLWWHVSWHYRITLNKQPYTREDQEYLTRKIFGLSAAKWLHVCSLMSMDMAMLHQISVLSI